MGTSQQIQRLNIAGQQYTISAKNFNNASKVIKDKKERDLFIKQADNAPKNNNITNKEYQAAMALRDAALRKAIENQKPKQPDKVDDQKEKASPNNNKAEVRKDPVEMDKQPVMVPKDDGTAQPIMVREVKEKVYAYAEFCQALKQLAIDDIKDSEISQTLVYKIKTLIKNGMFTWDNMQKLLNGDAISLTWKDEAGAEQKEMKLEGQDKKVFTKVFRGDSFFSKGWNKVSFNVVFGDPDYSPNGAGEKIASINSFKEFVEMAGAVEKWNKDETLQKYMGYSVGRKYQTYDSYFNTNDRDNAAKAGKALVNKDATKYISGEGLDVNGDNEVNDQDYVMIFARAVLRLDEEQRGRVLQPTYSMTGEKEYRVNFKQAEKVFGIKIEEEKEKVKENDKGTGVAADKGSKDISKGDYRLDDALGLDITVKNSDIVIYKEAAATESGRKDLIKDQLVKKVQAKLGGVELTKQALIDHFNKTMSGQTIDGVDKAEVCAKYLLKILNNAELLSMSLKDMQATLVNEIKTPGTATKGVSNKTVSNETVNNEKWAELKTKAGPSTYVTDSVDAKSKRVSIPKDTTVELEMDPASYELGREPAEKEYQKTGEKEKIFKLKITMPDKNVIYGFWHAGWQVEGNKIIRPVPLLKDTRAITDKGQDGGAIPKSKIDTLSVECNENLEPVIYIKRKVSCVKVVNGKDVLFVPRSAVSANAAEQKIEHKIDIKKTAPSNKIVDNNKKRPKI